MKNSNRSNRKIKHFGIYTNFHQEFMIVYQHPRFHFICQRKVYISGVFQLMGSTFGVKQNFEFQFPSRSQSLWCNLQSKKMRYCIKVVVLAEAALSIKFSYYLITISSKLSRSIHFYLTIRAFSLSCVIVRNV